jgi:hypothetical protein
MLILKLMIYSYMESWKLPILRSISKQTDIQFLADTIFFHLFFLLVVKNTTTEFHKSSVALNLKSPAESIVIFKVFSCSIKNNELNVSRSLNNQCNFISACM